MNHQSKVRQEALSDEMLRRALDGCSAEAIHLPGSIQPHGYLFVLSENFEIIKVSQNVCDLLQVPLKVLVGSCLCTYAEQDKLEKLRARISAGGLNEIRHATLSLMTETATPTFHAVMHLSGTYIILELEPQTNELGEHEPQDLHQDVIQFAARLQTVHSLTALHDYLVRHIQALTGFDRVKLYQFDSYWNGEVVAECRQPFMESYLGLHFPATDIPAQARQLYTLNYLRHIPEVDFTPVPLVPDDPNQPGNSIDLSFSCLRSVSSVHVEYLRNMGIEASMSISVMQNNRLWGLIACHHKTPHQVPYPVRMAVELIAHTFSASLSNFMQADEVTDAAKKRACVRELRSVLSPECSLLETLKSKHNLILNAVDADGVIVRIGGKTFAFGLIPEMSFAKELIQWLELNHDDEVFATDSIAKATKLPVLGQSMASGVLAVPVSASMSDYVMWLRQEQNEGVSWAGKPEKLISKTEAGYHLTPRASFDRWDENIRGHSKPWKSTDIEAAEHIAKLLLAKRHEDSLEQADENLQSILTNSSAFIYIIDVQGVILKMNDSFRTALGLESEETIGRQFKELLEGDLSRTIEENHAEILAAQKSMTFDQDFTFNNRSFSLVEVKFPLFDPHGDVYAIGSISTDIAKLRSIEQELERSNKELERVAFIASHDLQEPIRMIANFSRLLEQEYKDKKLDDTAFEYINFTKQSAERMRILIQDLLEYSRLGREEVQPVSINAEEELQSVLKQFYLSERHKQARIILKERMPDLMIKPEHFACLIQNLVSNALKYCRKDCEPIVEIVCEDRGEVWQLSVSDNGIGIKESYREKVFDIFQRLHNRSEYEGTGIGLALCKRIVERYRGDIWVESEFGVGSTFLFTLPKNATIVK